MRILLLSGEYPPMIGGVADYTMHLAHHLAAEGHDVGVLTSTRAEPVEQPRLRVMAEIGAWNVLAWPRILEIAREYDLVHIQYQAAAFDLGGAIPLLPDWLRVRGGPPVVVTFHDLRVPYLFPKAGRLRQAVVRRLAQRAHAVVTTNEEDEAILQAWGVRLLAFIPIGSNIPVQPPADFDADTWRARWGVSPEDWLIVYFGFINRSKGVHILLRAQDRLLRAGFRAKVLIVGDRLGASDPTNAAYLAEIEELVEELNLTDDWLMWTGHVPAAEVSAALKAADVVALPYTQGASLRHGTLIAALTHGAAVVTTEPRVPSRYLKPQHTVAVARRNHEGDFARRLALVLRRDDTKRRLQRGALEVAPEFDWKRIRDQHITLYEQLLAER
ncbi:glycosyltransferase family 4 protein [Ardenticatena maritima]|nr:glycosyltransferase family 4 protein [Ardenticatena maritima]